MKNVVIKTWNFKSTCEVTKNDKQPGWQTVGLKDASGKFMSCTWFAGHNSLMDHKVGDTVMVQGVAREERAEDGKIYTKFAAHELH